MVANWQNQIRQSLDLNFVKGYYLKVKCDADNANNDAK